MALIITNIRQCIIYGLAYSGVDDVGRLADEEDNNHTDEHDGDLTLFTLGLTVQRGTSRVLRVHGHSNTSLAFIHILGNTY